MYRSSALPIGTALEGEGGMRIGRRGWGSVAQNAKERGGSEGVQNLLFTVFRFLYSS